MNARLAGVLSSGPVSDALAVVTLACAAWVVFRLATTRVDGGTRRPTRYREGLRWWAVVTASISGAGIAGMIAVVSLGDPGVSVRDVVLGPGMLSAVGLLFACGVVLLVMVVGVTWLVKRSEHTRDR